MKKWRCRKPHNVKGARKCDLPANHDGPCHYSLSHGHGKGKRARTIHIAADLDALLVQWSQECRTSVSEVVARLIRLSVRKRADNNANDDGQSPPYRPAV